MQIVFGIAIGVVITAVIVVAWAAKFFLNLCNNH